jgi:hypothetical protein
MGVIISKKGTEKAYDHYVYNSYKTISLAIGDAISNGNSYAGNSGNDINTSFINYLSTLFGSQLLSMDDITSPTYIDLILKNGVVYRFYRAPFLGHIRISLPSANSKGRILDFYLDPDHYEYGLIPASSSSEENSLIVLDRIDLLPFAVDDGESGKIANVLNDSQTSYDIKYLDNNNKYLERYSYKEAFCKAYDSYSVTLNNVNFEIACGSSITSKKAGVLRLLNPKKVF